MGGNTGGVIGTGARNYPVYLITPDNVKHIITPVTTLIGSGFYSSSADVTSIVKGFTSGDFICGSIPANITAAATIGEGGGWLLALATNSNSGGYNYITLSISNDNYGQVGTNIPIVTPTTGVVRGMLMTAVIHAACDKGDALILQATRPFIAPNREGPNFFNSIISNNSGDGLPYTNATFGNNNNDPATRSNNINARQGLDLAIYETNGDIPPNTTTYYLDGYNGGVAFSPSEGLTNYIAYGTALNPSNATTTLKKSVDKQEANYGDNIIYTLNVVLDGSGSIGNLKLFDTIPDNTSFVSGSVYINGVNSPTANLSLGITLAQSANLPYSATVSYTAKINNIGIFQNIKNSFYVTFTNTIVGGTIFTNTIVSNFVTTTILNMANINLNKTVDKSYGGIGEILTYTIVLNNSGNLDVDTAVFIDTLPSDISLVPNSLFVDNVLNASASNPININLLPFSVGEIKTITFKGQTVNTIPNINPIVNSGYIGYSYAGNTGEISVGKISNLAITTINYASLYTTKSADKKWMELGNIITYTITVGYNVGNVIAENVRLIDTISVEGSLISNSLIVNGVQSSESLSSPGILLGSIPINGILTITFKVKIDTLPNGNEIKNSGYIKYTYKENPNLSDKNMESTSNITLTTIIAIKIDIIKYVDKLYATKENELKYSLIIKNTGNKEVMNASLIDTIPTGTSYVPGTLKLDGALIGGTPNNIVIGNIYINETKTIEYIVKIN